MLVRRAKHAGKSVDPITKVRRLIKRKTTERDRLLKEITECDTLLRPLQQQQRTMEALDQEIHELFRVLLANTKLSKPSQRNIRGVYEQLQAEQVISPDPTWVREGRCPCPACSALRDNDQEKVSEPSQAEGPVADGPQPRQAEPELRVQHRPEREASVRALYRKLALRFHPDRAEDEALRAEHEAVMKDVNDAYHGGDTERLLELSRELGIDVGELQEGGGLLAELVDQYERIKAEVRAIRNSPVGSLVAQMRRARQYRYRSPVEELNEQAEEALLSLTSVRDFVRDFAQGKISLETFLRGPNGPEDPEEMANLEEGLMELLEMVGSFERAARGSGRSARAKSRRGGVA
jgi:hypothetical protein